MKWKKWNTAMFVVALVALLMICGASIVIPMTAAEAIAEDLAPKLDLDEGALRKQLEDSLQPVGFRQAIIFSIPILVMIGLVTARAITERASTKT